MSAISMAQAPQAFAFQSTLKDAAGNPYANDTIDVKFDIYNSLSDTVYSELHSGIITSASGYFSVNVGQGDSLSGTFADIDWATSSYWLNLSVDTGGVMISLGASQLLSVPYALNAGKPASAYLGTMNTYYTGVDTIMIFDSTLVNTGDYNVITGKYNVAETGVYLVKFRNTEGLATCTLKKNNNIILLTSDSVDKLFYFFKDEKIYISSSTLGQDSFFQIIQIK